MNSATGLRRWIGDLPPAGGAISGAIEVVAQLTEQAERMAGKGRDELAMAQALGSAFAYMVAYVHYLSLDRCEPHDALARAAAGVPELEASERDFLLTLSEAIASR